MNREAMNTNIYTEDLIANALIQKLEHGHTREVSFSELRTYGDSLTNWWAKKKQICITVLLTKYYIDKLLFDYPNFFCIREVQVGNDREVVIRLKIGKTAEDLRKTFRPYLSVDMLSGFIKAYPGDISGVGPP